MFLFRAIFSLWMFQSIRNVMIFHNLLLSVQQCYDISQGYYFIFHKLLLILSVYDLRCSIFYIWLLSVLIRAMFSFWMFQLIRKILIFHNVIIRCYVLRSSSLYIWLFCVLKCFVYDISVLLCVFFFVLWIFCL